MRGGGTGGGGNPVVAFFLEVGAWLAASKTAQVIWTAFQIITVAVGIKNFRTAQDLLSKGQDILATKVAAGGKVPIIYGTRRVGSQLVFLDTADNRSKDLFCVYALSVGPVDHIDLTTMEINGVPITDTRVYRDAYYLGSDKIGSGAGSLNTVTQVGNINGTSSGGLSGTDPAKRYRFVANAHHGATSQTADPMLVASVGTKWTTAHKLNGIAYIAFSAEFDSKAMFKGLPQITVVVRGKKVYDPREAGQTFGTPSTYEFSNNPALCFLDYISNSEYGKGLGSSELNLTTFGTAATVCDTLVNTPDFNGSASAVTFSATSGTNLMTTTEAIWKKIRAGDQLFLTDSTGSDVFDGTNIDATSRDQYYDTTQTNKVFFKDNFTDTFTDETGTVLVKSTRFQCNGVIDANRTVMENSQALLASMRGIFNYVDGKYELSIEDTGTSTFSVTEDHIISDGGINVSYGRKDNRYNKVIVNFFNSQKGYEADTVTVLHAATTDSNDFTSDDGGEELEIKIDCEFVSSPYVAYNMGKGLLVRSRYQTQISFQATPELYKCNVGDIIDITYSGLDLSSAVYRIETIDLLPNGLLSVTAIIYFDVYTYSLPAAANVAPKANIPSPFAIQVPASLSFVDTDASSTGRAYLTWTAVTTYPTFEYRVVIKNGSSVAVYNNIVTSNYAFLDMLPAAAYTAEVTSINSVGAESEAGTLSFTIGDLPVRTQDVQTSAITTLKLAADAVTNAKIAVDAIQGDVIAAGAITTTKITDDAITTDKVAANAITASEIKVGTITATEIATNAITAIKINADAVTSDKIDVATLSAISADMGTITAGTINSGTVKATTINLNGTTMTADASGLKISTSGITTTEIGTRAVGAMALNGASGTSAFGDGRSGDAFATLSTTTFTSSDAGDYLIVGNCMVGGTFGTLTKLESRILLDSTVVADYESPAGASAIQPIILAGKITLAAATSYTVSLQGQVIADNTTPNIGGFSTRISAIKLSNQ